MEYTQSSCSNCTGYNAFQLYGGIPPITAYPEKQQLEVRDRLFDIAKKINLRTNINPNI